MNRNESGIPYFHQTLWRTGGGWRVCYPDQWSVTTMSKGGILSIKLLLQHPHPQLERLQQPCHKFLARWGAPSSLWCSCKGSRPPGFPSPSSGRRRVVSCVGRAEGLTFSHPDVVPPSPSPSLPSLWPSRRLPSTEDVVVGYHRMMSKENQCYLWPYWRVPSGRGGLVWWNMQCSIHGCLIQKPGSSQSQLETSYVSLPLFLIDCPRLSERLS